MTRHTLFLVHGMGRHDPASWWQEPWAQLKTLSKRYRFFQDQDLEDLVQPVGIHYDDHIEAALDRWDAQAEAFRTFAGRNHLTVAGSLDWLTGVGDDDAGFQVSHVVDVLIYRYFKLEQGRIRDSVKLQFARAIQAKLGQDSDARFSVVAHSLGTAVAHDALAGLGAAAELDGRANVLRAGDFRFDGIHMLANVSRVLQTSPKVYESVLQPSVRLSRKAYCRYLWSHRHAQDPFTLPKPFEPFGWSSAYQGEILRHYRNWNIHGFDHYLDHPRVHIPILNAMLGQDTVKPSELREAVDGYARFGGDFQAVAGAEATIGRLGQLAASLDTDQGLAENFSILLDMWKELGALKDQAEAALGAAGGGIA